MLKNNVKNEKGFTLVETLVSLSLFSVVLLITGGVIVSIIGINRKNQAISSVVSNLNYSIDSMIRDIKTGYAYRCDYKGINTVDEVKKTLGVSKKCDHSLTLISTISGTDTVVKYELIPSPDNNNYIQKTTYNIPAESIPAQYAITDKVNVNIDKLVFDVKIPAALDQKNQLSLYGQPSVFVVIKGESGAENVESSSFFVQTLVSQRLPNLTNFNTD